MKSRKILSIFAILMVVICIMACGLTSVSAAETDVTSGSGLEDAPNLSPSTGSSGLGTGSGSLINEDTGIEDIGGQLPVTTTDDILNWATTKGNEIIYMLQIFCQPFAILIFIVAAFMTLIGCIGKGDLVGKGVWGMVMSVVVYAAVLYAPVILQTFVGWVAS